jgi:hypothetical protein
VKLINLEVIILENWKTNLKAQVIKVTFLTNWYFPFAFDAIFESYKNRRPYSKFSIWTLELRKVYTIVASKQKKLEEI